MTTRNEESSGETIMNPTGDCINPVADPDFVAQMEVDETVVCPSDAERQHRSRTATAALKLAAAEPTGPTDTERLAAVIKNRLLVRYIDEGGPPVVGVYRTDILGRSLEFVAQGQTDTEAIDAAIDALEVKHD